MKTKIISIIVSLICSQFVFGQSFSYKSTNPFGLEYVATDSSFSTMKLLFYDVDADDDLDAIITGVETMDFSKVFYYSQIKYFMNFQENIGTKLQPVFAPRKPFMNPFPYPDGYFTPAIGDLNHDNLPDFIVCCGVDSSFNLKPQYYERQSIMNADPFKIIDSDSLNLNNFTRGSVFLPELADMDKDGDLDLLMSGFETEESEIIGKDRIRTYAYFYAKNIGTIAKPVFAGWYHNPYGLIPGNSPQMSIVGDIDNDSDNDVLSLIQKNNTTYFSFIENIPQPDGRPQFLAGINSPFTLPGAGMGEELFGHSLVDIDADGDLDLFVEQKLINAGTGIGYYENNLCSSSSISISQQICQGDSVVIGSNIFKTTGNHYVTIEKPNRCDSIIHLSLAVLPLDQINLQENICEGEVYTIGNQTFNQSGHYPVTLSNINGCDSIINLNLTVFSNDHTTLTESLCEGASLTVGNQTFQQSGQYEVTLTGIHGCDSIINLNLTIYPKSITNLTSSICQGAVFNIGNQSFNQTGQYEIFLINSNGCDSIVNLNLIVHPIFTTNLIESLCSGSTFTIGNQSFTQSGQYEVTLNTINGCDSIVNATLTFIVLNDTVTQTQNNLTSNQNNANYQWFDCIDNTDIVGAISQTFMPTKNGKYGVRITDISNCQVTSDCYDFVLSGIEVLLLSNRIILFPNPAADNFTIMNNTGYALTGIKIISSTGITERILPNNQSERISTAELSGGNYIIEMICNGCKIYKKLAVSKD
ncbi:MAG: T9SS type A sorting domain-containing protein [Saprospiraceae bacterium]|nr:T9SS type A sorting domain-containing protein [Saprospiraceae bacterium]